MPDGSVVNTSTQFGADESMSSNEGWSHEFRIQSNYDGNLNFLLGGMMLDYESRNRYVVQRRSLVPGSGSAYQPSSIPCTGEPC